MFLFIFSQHALKNGDISEPSDKPKGTSKRKPARKNKSQKKNTTTPLKQVILKHRFNFKEFLHIVFIK